MLEPDGVVHQECVCMMEISQARYEPPTHNRARTQSGSGRDELEDRVPSIGRAS